MIACALSRLKLPPANMQQLFGFFSNALAEPVVEPQQTDEQMPAVKGDASSGVSSQAALAAAGIHRSVVETGSSRACVRALPLCNSV